MTKANLYMNVVTNRVKRENIFHNMYLYAFKQRKIKELFDNNPAFEFDYENVNFEDYDEYDGDDYKAQEIAGSVSHLHTGSIPSMFGKPLMVLGEISPTIVRSHSELASDHDVMLVLDNMPVVEVDGKTFNTIDNTSQINQTGIWLGKNMN